MKLSKIYPHAIFDFDGTLTKLKINWSSIREYLKVESILEVWDFPVESRKIAFELITRHEIAGVYSQLLVPEKELNRFESYSILTNNSEKCVESFFENLRKDKNINLQKATLVLGRESLKGPKENAVIFIEAIEKIKAVTGTKNNDEYLYVGDQIYEKVHAQNYGIMACFPNDLSNHLL